MMRLPVDPRPVPPAAEGGTAGAEAGPRLCGFDCASALSLGQREVQEDALAIDFPLGADLGMAVLADGMGGHAAGDVAAAIVVTEVFAELKLRAAGLAPDLHDVPDLLRGAAAAANACVAAHVAAHPATGGMGATLVALVAAGDRLCWISVGDSPLWLFRDGTLRQLNEDHSLAPQIDYMVRSGQMDAETGRNHPDRNCLTSALMGGSIGRTDCPAAPFRLQPGDVVLAASDGLQFLGDERIAAILGARASAPAARIAKALLDAVHRLADPHQDNVSLFVLCPQPADDTATADRKRGLPKAEPKARRKALPEPSDTEAGTPAVAARRHGGLLRQLIGGLALWRRWRAAALAGEPRS